MFRYRLNPESIPGGKHDHIDGTTPSFFDSTPPPEFKSCLPTSAGAAND